MPCPGQPKSKVFAMFERNVLDQIERGTETGSPGI